MYIGKTEEQKNAMADAIAREVVATTGCSETVVSVAIEEINPEEWPEAVYKPDILGHPERLYRKPQYNPFDSAGKKADWIYSSAGGSVSPSP